MKIKMADVPTTQIDLPFRRERFDNKPGYFAMADLYCGAGGTSAGAMQAFREHGSHASLVGVNHWRRAIETHEANHSGDNSIHLLTGVDKVDIAALFGDVPLWLLWGSPSCVHHSVARGGAPLNEQDRSTGWSLVQWARQKRPEIILVENVMEFKDWGPCIQRRDPQGVPLFIKKNSKGSWDQCYAPGKVRPSHLKVRAWWKKLEEQGYFPALGADPARKGETFRKWVKHLQRLGYDLDTRVLNAADYGAPTSRRRLFVQAVRRDSGRKIIWPEPTHEEPNTEGVTATGRLPWRCARDIIDWSNLGSSIFTRKKDLSVKTIRRISVGLIKFGLEAAIVKLKGTGTANSAALPLGTVQAGGMHYALMQPGVMQADGSVAVLIPQHRGRGEQLRVKSVDAPLPAITTKGAEAIAQAQIIQPRFLVPQFGERVGQVPRTHSVAKPIPAVTSHGAGALVQGELTPFLVTVNHGNGLEGDKANGRRTKSIDAPLGALTTSRSHALVLGAAQGLPSAGEVPSVISDHETLAAVITDGIARAKKDPSFRPLISFCGAVFRLDVHFRMLTWRELARGQGFPSDYFFSGNDTEKLKQIGNAVVPHISRALVLSHLQGNGRILPFEEENPAPVVREQMAC
jgi:DNA (cytosine-5)-methyltransferase 1